MPHQILGSSPNEMRHESKHCARTPGRGLSPDRVRRVRGAEPLASVVVRSQGRALRQGQSGLMLAPWRERELAAAATPPPRLARVSKVTSTPTAAGRLAAEAVLSPQPRRAPCPPSRRRSTLARTRTTALCVGPCFRHANGPCGQRRCVRDTLIRGLCRAGYLIAPDRVPTWADADVKKGRWLR